MNNLVIFWRTEKAWSCFCIIDIWTCDVSSILLVVDLITAKRFLAIPERKIVSVFEKLTLILDVKLAVNKLVLLDPDYKEIKY